MPKLTRYLTHNHTSVTNNICTDDSNIINICYHTSPHKKTNDNSAVTKIFSTPYRIYICSVYFTVNVRPINIISRQPLFKYSPHPAKLETFISAAVLEFKHFQNLKNFSENTILETRTDNTALLST